MARTPHPQPHPGGDAGGVRRRTHDLNARVRQFVGARHRPWLVPLVTLLAVVAVIAGAVIVSSVTQRHLQLDDGTVWVTSLQDGKAARYNVRLQEPDTAVAASDPKFDVAQQGASTVLAEGTQVSAIHPSTISLADSSPTGAAVQSFVANGTLALFNRARGDVWVGDAGDVKALNAAETPAHMKLGVGGLAAVTADGTVYGYRPKDGMVLAIDDRGAPDHVRKVGSLSDGKAQSADSFTVVDGQGVISDGDDIIWNGGRATFADAAPLVLQAPSADGKQGAWVAAGAPSGLALVDLTKRGGEARLIASGGQGEPAQPASSGGCVYAAFAQHTNNSVRACSAADDPAYATLEEVTPTSQLQFRVNHRLVVLNDVANGNIWNPDDSTDVIKIQWKTIETQQNEAERSNDDSTSNKHTFEKTCSTQSGQIKAVDDTFGVRAGAHQILDVLRNDEQTDCSVLRITSVSAPKNGTITVSPIYDGRYLQLDASHAGAGAVTFTYEIGDGRDQTSQGTVTLNVTGAENHAPRQTDAPEQIDVEQGASYTGNVLGAFTDDDGDPLTLVNATVENTDEATVSTRADGLLTFHAGSMAAGRATVRLTVSDGRETATGTVYFSVRPANTLPAVIDPLIRRATPGTATRVPLKQYVHGTSAEPARLTQVDTPDKATTTLNASDMSFSFTAQTPGTYYVPYTVTQGTIPATGLARIEVEALTEDTAKPVAANDVALLGADNTAIVEPLANDVDPMGGVLSVTSVKAPANANVKVGLVANKRVYLTAVRMPTEPVPIEYTVANEVGTSNGTIVLQPPALSHANRAPKASNVNVSVRTGGIVSVDVPDHVSYSDGTTITLGNDLQYDPETFRGLVFVASDIVRYQAPAEPGSYPVTYTVRDNLGNAASATITFAVHEANAETKAEANPIDVDAQVAAGQKIRIPITLRGIDADGDDVQLLGLGNTAPAKGRIAEVGADYLIYEAYTDSTGTDEFTYAVEDWTGRRAQASVRVGIFQSGANSTVYARDDTITLRPNTTTTVPVLINDVASDDSELTVSDHLELQGISEASVHDGQITFTTPDKAGTAFIVYSISNAAGLSDTATLTVTTDPQAPIDPPTAYDYRVPAIATIDKRSVDVDVSPWIANPSGGADELEVGIDPSAAGSARVRGGTTITVDLTDEARAVPYTVTNTTHNVTSTAFIQVPAYGVFPPTLRPKAPALTVNAGSTITINIADYVRVGAGKTAVVESRDSVSATKAANADLYVDDQTLSFTAPDDYSGPASITFTATDGKREGRQGGVKLVNSAVITLPITVVGGQTPPPTFSSTAVDVVAGESPITIDLTALTHSAASGDHDPYTYRGGATASGITANLSAEGKLVVSAEASAKPGATASVPIAIDYGHGEVNAGITVRVVASLRPLARVSGTTTKLNAGETVTVPVLQGAYNPFPDEPLKIVDAAMESGSTLTLATSGDSLSVTAPQGTSAQSARVVVTVEDATGSAARHVTATFTFTIAAVPDAPRLSPVGGDAQDGAVALQWTPGNANGSPITEYEVRWNGGQKVCGAVTTCQVTGLKNGTTYLFTVRAKNAVGWSADSNQVEGKPDRAPEAPANVEVKGGYRSASVSWSTGNYEGTRPDSYTVRLVGPRGWTQQQSGVTSSPANFEIPNNVIGEGSFTATVIAHNPIGDSKEGVSKGTSDVWGDPEAPAVKLEQVDDEHLRVSMTPGHLRGTGCTAVTLSRGSGMDCSGGSVLVPITGDMYFTDVTVKATITPAKPGVTPRVRRFEPRAGECGRGHVERHGQRRQRHMHRALVHRRRQGDRSACAVRRHRPSRRARRRGLHVDRPLAVVPGGHRAALRQGPWRRRGHRRKPPRPQGRPQDRRGPAERAMVAERRAQGARDQQQRNRHVWHGQRDEPVRGFAFQPGARRLGRHQHGRHRTRRGARRRPVVRQGHDQRRKVVADRVGAHLRHASQAAGHAHARPVDARTGAIPFPDRHDRPGAAQRGLRAHGAHPHDPHPHAIHQHPRSISHGEPRTRAAADHRGDGPLHRGRRADCRSTCGGGRRDRAWPVAGPSHGHGGSGARPAPAHGGTCRAIGDVAGGADRHAAHTKPPDGDAAAGSRRLHADGGPDHAVQLAVRGDRAQRLAGRGGQGAAGAPVRHRARGRRPHPARRLPGHRQDAARARLGPLDRHVVQTHPVHTRPAAERRGRRHVLRPEDRRVQLPQRPDLRVDRARRRDQPRLAEDAVRAARGDGGAEGDRGRRHLRRAAALRCHRHAEPGRTARHLQAARSADGPLSHQDHDRLPLA